MPEEVLLSEELSWRKVHVDQPRATNKLARGMVRLHEDSRGVLLRLEETLGSGLLEYRGVARGSISYPTGIPSLDGVLGGGVPSGLTEIYGVEGAGKSTLVFEMIRSAQSLNLEVALATGEYWDSVRARKLGVDLEKLTIIRGSDGEQVLEVCASFVEDRRRALFVDSLTSLRPEVDEFDNWLGMVWDWVAWTRPRLGTESSVVAVNQVRVRRSVDPRLFFADGTTSTAHRIAGEFDTRLELSRMNVHEESYDLVVNVVANLISTPHRYITLPVDKAGGVDVWRDVVRVAAQKGVLTKEGPLYYCDGMLIGRGEKDTAKTLSANEEFGAYVFNATLRA
jgi:hypothetical protein